MWQGTPATVERIAQTTTSINMGEWNTPFASALHPTRCLKVTKIRGASVRSRPRRGRERYSTRDCPTTVRTKHTQTTWTTWTTWTTHAWPQRNVQRRGRGTATRPHWSSAPPHAGGTLGVHTQTGREQRHLHAHTHARNQPINQSPTTRSTRGKNTLQHRGRIYAEPLWTALTGRRSLKGGGHANAGVQIRGQHNRTRGTATHT